MRLVSLVYMILYQSVNKNIPWGYHHRNYTLSASSHHINKIKNLCKFSRSSVLDVDDRHIFVIFFIIFGSVATTTRKIKMNLSFIIPLMLEQFFLTAKLKHVLNTSQSFHSVKFQYIFFLLNSRFIN